jgi:hypothetical protein
VTAASSPVRTDRGVPWVRVAAGVALLLGASVHLERWMHGYRELSVGPSFLANVVASVVVATALFAWHDRISVIVGLVLSLGSVAALVISRTVGLFGFEEAGFDRPALEAIVFEAIAVVLLATCLIWPPRPHAADDPGP